ncbi:hypothetical protein B0H11DRAFT_2327009 [Mycena galericulata]|nr:hypothetical protein B0H11DRAFT_2327009 [Mycena galericulata]
MPALALILSLVVYFALLAFYLLVPVATRRIANTSLFDVPPFPFSSHQSSTENFVLSDVPSAYHYLARARMEFADTPDKDTVNPLNSGLVLSNGRPRIEELMPSETAICRWLSSARVKLRKAITVHRTRQMDDRDGPKIAATFYERLQPLKFPDLAKSAEALNHAVNKLKEGKDAIHLRWVPFVHYGL